MPDPQTATSLHQVVAAAGYASLDDFIDSPCTATWSWTGTWESRGPITSLGW